MAQHQARHIGVGIARNWREVYNFARHPENFARWASGLGASLKREGNQWIAEGPDGPVSVRFSDENAHGVLDHRVKTASGEEIYIPRRVIENGDGAEVILTLYRLPAMSDEVFARDENTVTADLARLKQVLES